MFITATNRRLFAIYHPPEGPSGASSTVLLCPPGPQEYMPSHWAIRRLATQLARAGHHVLRFDYFGTGDSEGESTEGDLDQWQTDIVAAANALCELTDTDRPTLIGYRLGASLAWRASQQLRERARNLVLWQPVVRGRDYLRNLADANHWELANRLHYVPPKNPPDELLGYPLSERQRVTTEELDLLTEPVPNATRVYLYYEEVEPGIEELQTRLARDVRRFTSEHVANATASRGGVNLSNRVLTVITTALSRGAN